MTASLEQIPCLSAEHGRANKREARVTTSKRTTGWRTAENIPMFASLCRTAGSASVKTSNNQIRSQQISRSAVHEKRSSISLEQFGHSELTGSQQLKVSSQSEMLLSKAAQKRAERRHLNAVEPSGAQTCPARLTDLQNTNTKHRCTIDYS